jgi:DNA helicase-2/ATP-dependent DNA helicase PcrA
VSELNEPQLRAVTHGAGPLIIFAGAGSGKTRTVTYRVANLLAEHRVAPYRILAVTFTNKAAGELRSRIEQLAGPELARDLWVGTFHAVCARLLRRYFEQAGLERSFSIYDETDQRAVVTRAIRSLGLDERAVPPRFALARIHGQKREGRPPAEVELSDLFSPALLEVYERYEAALAAANAVDFEDLILRVMRIAEDPDSTAGEELRRRFLHVVVDEFQDTNSTQYRLIRALVSRHRNLCVVGDDDQSIYRWRGADVRIIRGFLHDFPDASVVKLEQNYRSTRNIVAAALAVIQPAREREPKELWTAAESGEAIVVRQLDTEREEADFVARTVRSEIARGVGARQCAVFYRVHAQSRVLEEAFRAANLPYQIVGGMRFFERAEVKDLLAYLRLIDNPRSDADLLRIVNVPGRGIGDKSIERLLDVAAERAVSCWRAIELVVEDGELLPAAATKKLAAFRELVEELRCDASDLRPDELAEQVLQRTGYRALLENADNAESDARLGNLSELVGSIAQYAQSAVDADQKPALAEYLERVSLVTSVDTLTDAPAVSLMTVHAAKGLEFSTVLLTGMEEAVFPYRGLEGDEPEELDEERRLAYVALTRARERLFITHTRARMLFGKTRYLEPSRFLDDLPEEVVRREGWVRPRWSGTRVGLGSGPRLRPGERIVERDFQDEIPDSEPGRTFGPGDRVMHKSFGEGIVERVEHGAALTVVARFGDGTRRVRASYLAPR